MKVARCFAWGFALLPLSACAADWGDVTGRFVLDGKTPAPETVTVEKDVAVCGKFNLVDESLVVSPQGGLKNVIVHIYVRRGSSAPPVHPDVKSASRTLDNKGCRFAPHVLCMSTADELIVSNSDPIGHTSKIEFFANNPQNPTLAAGAKLSLKGQVNNPEILPSSVSCGIHPWMKGWVFVQAHPYSAVSDDDGNFVLENVPTGEWTFRIWHEASGYVRDVQVGSTKTDDRRGTFALTVKPGKNDLGEIKVPSSLFND